MVELADRQGDQGLRAHRPGAVRRAGLQPRRQVAVLHRQRRRRVRRAAPRRTSADLGARGGAEGRLGHRRTRTSRTTASTASSRINEDGSTSVQLYDAATGAEVPLPALPAGEIRGLTHRPLRAAHGVLPQRRPPAQRPVRARVRRRADAADDVAEPGDRSGRSGRFAGGALQELRRHGDPQHPVEAAPGDRAEPRRRRWCWVHGGPGGQTTRALQRRHPVPRQPRLRGARHQQPRQLGLRQDLLRRRRRQARPRAAVGHASTRRSTCSRSTTSTTSKIGIIGGSYGGYMVARRAGLPARRIRRRRQHLRRIQLGAHAGKHPAVLGELPPGAVPGDRRSAKRSATS